MPGIAIALFFGLGLILSLVGYIWGLVQAFGQETFWGVLYLIVPCAALVFYIKNWSNQQIRKTFLIQCAGLLMFILGGLTTSVFYGANFTNSPDSELNQELKNNNPSPSSFPGDLNTSPSPSQKSPPSSGLSPQSSLAPDSKDEFKQSMKLGYVYYAQRDYPTALIHFNKALQVRPGDAYAVKAIENTKSALAKPSKRIVQAKAK
ncbi:tetratricopeptide repeat protein [Microcoleus sp. A2-C5]|uniref:tetratricopeptide repeat protein n=1 Tax=Microcoleaceae TaxID=1892252 RepID=UPI002237C442|nr:tetratricopeptide repeat protein [Lyngbya sp. CCAP 1446/10]MCW6052111.1 tetratricopeptide repeat protein [Lyngbya sp. CCAP 1446/10]